MALITCALRAVSRLGLHVDRHGSHNPGESVERTRVAHGL